MASLRLPGSPSAPYLSTDNLTFLKTALSSPFHKPFNQSNNNTFSLSISHSHIIPFKTKHFIVHFSASATQDPILEPQSLLESKTEKEQEQEQEEFSTTRVLASNVPWNCTTEDIRALFEKFGTVVDVELSMYNKTRNRGLAFVSMGSPEEAATAIKSLDSYEFEGRSLKMNYAKLKKEKPLPPLPPKPVPTFNLFVANLPFDAKDNDLKEFFKSEGADIASAEIVYHNHDKPRKPSGYGFVAFKTKKEADAALSTFADKVFMGRPIRVARSKQFVRQPREEGQQSDDTSTDLNIGVEQADTTNDI
ncbi:ribonucleoprotein, chloroplast, putative [Ricinus communis]|uniref:Ribonucleoprotein, chloroplast, putative n=1 Tax=Ricinus communis TaxID=3988 RepID=B9RJR2_RICCO|nr:ribonucleoprotein, chloroplast, putative [Ricinus communis]|eukprot:XP_002513981.1 28 kDa ribonucleoprotein, chloroplastic [Ricinus communis]